MLTREEIIDKIADLFIDNSDDDGSWNPSEITEAVMAFIVRESSESQPVRLVQCGECSTWYPAAIYDGCPYYDTHICGDCGNQNQECTCDDCPTCGIYYEDCECPRCTKCENPRHNCTCPEEEAVFA
jgi:hypothetical protein